MSVATSQAAAIGGADEVPTTCPVCQSALGSPPFVRIPSVPVHCNVLWPSRDAARAAPRGDIALTFCDRCGHVFNRAFDPADTTYGDAYENSLHHSDVFQEYAGALIEEVVARHDLRGRQVVEVGAGQADFLRMLCAAGGCRGTGYDPSAVDVVDTGDGVRLVPSFFDERAADQPADAVVCRQVLEHVADPHQLLGQVRRAVSHRGGWVLFEVPDAEWSLRHGGIWDLIYEHCGYFTRPSLRTLFGRHGFQVDRLRAGFGGQFLVLEASVGVGAAPTDPSADVERLAEDVERFAHDYAEAVRTWGERLARLASEGRTAVVWGAGSKGVSFLNAIDGTAVIRAAVDINPRKRGRHVAGTGQAIIAPEQLAEDPPDVVLVMNPNYRDEIRNRMDALGLRPQVVAVSS